MTIGSPKIALTKVDLPEPLSPVMATRSWEVTDRLMPCRIGVPYPQVPSWIETRVLEPPSVPTRENLGFIISGSRIGQAVLKDLFCLAYGTLLTTGCFYSSS